MPKFTVTTAITDELESHNIEADYYVNDDGQFTTFKSGTHKQVASFHNRTIVSIKRNDATCRCSDNG